MWCQGLLSRKRGNVIFKPTLLSTVWCKCLSSVLRAQTCGWPRRCSPIIWTSCRALLWPAGALPWQHFTKQLQHRRKPGLQWRKLHWQNPHSDAYITFEWEGRGDLTTAILSPASQFCVKGIFSHLKQNSRKTQVEITVDSHEPPQWAGLTLYLHSFAEAESRV